VNENIKTGTIICKELDNPKSLVEYHSMKDRKWVSVEWLEKELKEKMKEYPCTTSSECIENISAKEVFAWLLTLLEG
jgi:hypothetical protein